MSTSDLARSAALLMRIIHNGYKRSVLGSLKGAGVKASDSNLHTSVSHS